MSHKDYSILRNQIGSLYPEFDLNGDGIVDPVTQGISLQAGCDTKPGCAVIDGFACSPKLKNGPDEPVAFSRAPAHLGKLFGKAAAFVFTQSTMIDRTLRFFPDNPDNPLFESPSSFSVGQVAGYFDTNGKFVTFQIEGFAIGLTKEGRRESIHVEPAQDKTGRPIRIAYGIGPDGRQIQKPLADLIWATPDGTQAVDPNILISGGSRERNLSEIETQLLPLFKKAKDIARKYKKIQLAENGGGDLRSIRLTSQKIRQQARDEMELVIRKECPRSISPNFAIWDGIRIALGKAAGLRRIDLVLPIVHK